MYTPRYICGTLNPVYFYFNEIDAKKIFTKLGIIWLSSEMTLSM